MRWWSKKVSLQEERDVVRLFLRTPFYITHLWLYLSHINISVMIANYRHFSMINHPSKEYNEHNSSSLSKTIKMNVREPQTSPHHLYIFSCPESTQVLDCSSYQFNSSTIEPKTQTLRRTNLTIPKFLIAVDCHFYIIAGFCFFSLDSTIFILPKWVLIRRASATWPPWWSPWTSTMSCTITYHSPHWPLTPRSPWTSWTLRWWPSE